MHALLLKTQSSCPQLVTVHFSYTASAWLQLQLCVAGPVNVASHDCVPKVQRLLNWQSD